MTSPLRRRTTTAAFAALCVGALLTATAPATWAASAPTAGDSTTGSASSPAAASPSTAPADGGRTVVLNDDGSATVTIDAEHVKALCERVPAARARVAKLLDRVKGGADVKGSAAWLSARADKARTAGRDEQADRLEKRAARRTDRVGQLTKADARLARTQQDVCVPLAEQLANKA